MRKSAREPVDKRVELRIGQSAIDVAVTLGELAVNIVCPK
jgi:hypothetical protein